MSMKTTSNTVWTYIKSCLNQVVHVDSFETRQVVRCNNNGIFGCHPSTLNSNELTLARYVGVSLVRRDRILVFLSKYCIWKDLLPQREYVSFYRDSRSVKLATQPRPGGSPGSFSDVCLFVLSRFRHFRSNSSDIHAASHRRPSPMNATVSIDADLPGERQRNGNLDASGSSTKRARSQTDKIDGLDVMM